MNERTFVLDVYKRQIHSPHHNNSVSSRINLKVHIHIITSFHTLSLRTNIPVSYTHLDVYKRQEQAFALITEAMSLSAGSC